jgi:hypothetical protein
MYRSRVDIVFGKAQLWNSDLLDAFTSCLQVNLRDMAGDINANCGCGYKDMLVQS